MEGTHGTRRPLFSERRGAGGAGDPAIVCLHGLAGSGRYWYPVAEQLCDARLQLHLIDLLGFGRSPWPDVAYTLDDHLAALEGWRAAAGLADAPLALVGHSLGALLALEWAARAPGLAGAVLVSLPVYRAPEEAPRQLAGLSLLHWLTLASPPLARATCTLMCAARPAWRLLVPLILSRVPPAVASDGVLHTWRSLSGTLEHVIFGLTFERVRRKAEGLPLTFVHGGADETAPIGTVRELAAGLPTARLVEVSGGGHDLPLAHPDCVAAAVSAAVAELEEDGGAVRAAGGSSG